MRKADMTGLDLSYADLSNAHLENAIMNATVLYRTNLSSAKLTDTMLFNTDLQQVSARPPPSALPPCRPSDASGISALLFRLALLLAWLNLAGAAVGCRHTE